MKVYVNYEEWLNNLTNPEWQGWQKIKYIMTTVNPSKYTNDWRQHALFFLNNYQLEKKVKQILHLDWNGIDHEDLIEGKGKNAPDFVDKSTGYTFELKQMFDAKSLLLIKPNEWHGADYKLVYFRNERALYRYDDTTGNLTYITNIRYMRVYLNHIDCGEDANGNKLVNFEE